MRKEGSYILIGLVIIIAITIGIIYFNNSSNQINIPKDYDERTEYCRDLCRTLYTHDACANDCMAQVVSEYVENAYYCSFYENQIDSENHNWDYFLERLEGGNIETIHLNSGECENYFWIELKDYPQPDKIWIKMNEKEDLSKAIDNCGNVCKGIEIV